MNKEPYCKKLHFMPIHWCDEGISNLLHLNASRLGIRIHFLPLLNIRHASLVFLRPKDQPTQVHFPYSFSKVRSPKEIFFRFISQKKEHLPLLLEDLHCCINLVPISRIKIDRLFCKPKRRSKHCCLIRKQICWISLFQ